MITHEELMRYIDGELEPERMLAVEAALESDTELRRDYLLYSRMKTDLESLGEHMKDAGTVWTPVSRAIARPLGWILFILGAVIWMAYGVYAYLTSADAMWEKLSTSAVVVGLAMLLLSALLDRLHDLKSDPYRSIER
ncbi:MAG: hypothetical protein KY466_08850 [Gemmatimonadetes bacterium]|nr:hypothetical protein [Gemmatimonadota bacterium]